MKISMIVAMGKCRQIGKDNQMLWYIKEDFKHFKETTLGYPLIMGRKTYESIGRPLPKRTTIILTRNSDYQMNHPNVFVAHTKEEALQIAQEQGGLEVFVCGGEQVYASFLNDAEKLYLSRVDFDGKADAFFPEFEHLCWKLLKSQSFVAQSQSPAWSLEILEKV